jgi:hypothetical protein
VLRISITTPSPKQYDRGMKKSLKAGRKMVGGIIQDKRIETTCR